MLVDDQVTMAAAPALRNDSFRPTRTSLAEAIDAFRKMDVNEDAEFTIVTAPWQLHDGTLTGMVCIQAREQSRIQQTLPMPVAKRFTARTTLNDPLDGDIADLNGATFDSDGNVTLADGRHLHTLILIPSSVAYQLDNDREQVVELTIAFLEAETICYREEALPGGYVFRALNYATLSQLTISNLKPLLAYVCPF